MKNCFLQPFSPQPAQHTASPPSPARGARRWSPSPSCQRMRGRVQVQAAGLLAVSGFGICQYVLLESSTDSSPRPLAGSNIWTPPKDPQYYIATLGELGTMGSSIFVGSFRVSGLRLIRNPEVDFLIEHCSRL